MLHYKFVFSDAANGDINKMSEQVEMVEVKTEPNESDELIPVCKNTDIFDNNSIQDELTSESKI